VKAIVFPGDRTAEVREVPDPAPGPRDVKRKPSIAGHEPCGVVVEVGRAVTEHEARVGDRVMQHHYDGCGVCRHCTSGWTQLCEVDPLWFGSMTGDGSHAQYMRAPAHTLVSLPDELSFSAGSAVACGTGTAFGAIKRIAVRLSATMLASEMGARVIAIDLSEERRAAAREHGAIAAIDPTTEDAVAIIKELTRGEGAHKSIETSAAESARTAAVQSTRTWGTVAIVGIGGNLVVESFFELIKKQLSIVGHLTFSKAGLADCAHYVVERGIDVDSLFSHSWALDQASEAYELFDQQKTGKAWFDPTR